MRAVAVSRQEECGARTRLAAAPPRAALPPLPAATTHRVVYSEDFFCRYSIIFLVMEREMPAMANPEPM